MIPLLQRWKEIHRSFTHTSGCRRCVANQPLGHLRFGFSHPRGALLPASQCLGGSLAVDGVVASISEARTPKWLGRFLST